VEPPDQIVNRNCQGSRRESERRTNGQSTMEASVIRTRKWDRLHKRVGNASSVPLHFLRRRTSRSRAALSLVRSPCIVSLDPWPPRHPRVPTCSMQNTEFNPTSQLCLVQISDTTPPRSSLRSLRLPDPPSCRILIASAFCSGVEMRMTVGPIPVVVLGMASPSARVGAGVTGGEGRCPGASCGGCVESEQVSVGTTV
jgi:hypothetical protein